jgi:zinc protease
MRLALLLALLFTGVTFAQVSDNVQAITLKNGMRVLVQEDHAIPTTALYFFYRVGSRDERPGITGISHFFEHMMFNGSQHFGPGEFDRQMEVHGGNNNAYTTKDVTVYTDWFPPDALELMMRMESDRMAHLVFQPKIVESERGVVYSERRLRVDNDNLGALSEQVGAAAIIAHPYHWPVIGWASDIEAWTMQDLETYYKEGYAPNNCVMVVAGDVNTDRVFQLTKQYFEAIPSHATFGEPRTVEPKQEGERVVHIRKEAELPLLMMAFHMPPTKSPEYPAIELLETILATGQSSRLYSRLVNREQAALNAQVFDEPSLDPYLLGIVVEPRAGVDVNHVRALVVDELEKIKASPVPEAELQKAKNQWLAAHYRELKSNAGRANMLGTYEVFYGDYKKLYEEPAEVEKVTAEAVQHVAQQILTPENRTVGILTPQPKQAQEARR